MFNVMNIDVISRYNVRISTYVMNEIERIVSDNTNGLLGTSPRITQLAQWITTVIRYIKSLGDLSDATNYQYRDAYYFYNTNIYDDGIGEFAFRVSYDKAVGLLVIIDSVSWNFKQNSRYNLLIEHKNSKIVLKESQLRNIIKESIKKVLNII